MGPFLYKTGGFFSFFLILFSPFLFPVSAKKNKFKLEGTGCCVFFFLLFLYKKIPPRRYIKQNPPKIFGAGEKLCYIFFPGFSRGGPPPMFSFWEKKLWKMGGGEKFLNILFLAFFLTPLGRVSSQIPLRSKKGGEGGGGHTPIYFWPSPPRPCFSFSEDFFAVGPLSVSQNQTPNKRRWGGRGAPQNPRFFCPQKFF